MCRVIFETEHDRQEIIIPFNFSNLPTGTVELNSSSSTTEVKKKNKAYKNTTQQACHLSVSAACMLYVLCDLQVTTAGSYMQRRPALAVHLVHIGTLGQEETHHLHAPVDARLW